MSSNNDDSNVGKWVRVSNIGSKRGTIGQIILNNSPASSPTFNDYKVCFAASQKLWPRSPTAAKDNCCSVYNYFDKSLVKIGSSPASTNPLKDCTHFSPSYPPRLYHPPPIPPPIPPRPSPPPKHNSLAIGLGVGLGLGIPLIFLVLFLIIRRKRQPKPILI